MPTGYGYRRITAMLRSEGWTVNAKRVERIWRREGLKVPQKQRQKGRLWLRTHDGRNFRLLDIIDEFTRECLAIRVDRKLNSTDVIDRLWGLFILRGGHISTQTTQRYAHLADDPLRRAAERIGDELNKALG
jgi:putative transposase